MPEQKNSSAHIDQIDHIVLQTRMLALNALVETAHAGDSGKGFAIVAKELRVLSDMIKQSLLTIEESSVKAVEQV